MLNESERWAFHLFGWMCTAAFLLYTYAFVSGFMDGVQGNPSKTTGVEAAVKTAAKLLVNATTSPTTVEEVDDSMASTEL
jgi:hypothetical protein